MAEHTPGPWKLVGPTRDGKTIVVRQDGDGWHRPEMYVCSDDCDYETAEVNARVIAASPLYYEGVALMLANEQCGGDGWWKGWEILKAAHTKANGGEYAKS